MPSRLQGATSQRVIGVAMIWVNMSDALPPVGVVEQAVSPSHQPYSTPAWNRPMPPLIAMAMAASAVKAALMRGVAFVAKASKASGIAAMCG